METPLKCFWCGEKATHAFILEGFTTPVCKKCSKLFEVKTIPLLQVLKGGKDG